MEYLGTILGSIMALIVFLTIKHRSEKPCKLCSLCKNCIATKRNMDFKDEIICGMNYTVINTKLERKELDDEFNKYMY